MAAFILINGFGLVKDTISPMLGEAPDNEFVKNFSDKILSYPGVLGIHDLMIHDYGPGRKFASVHVEMSASEDVIKSHDMIDNIESDIFDEENIHLVIHYDPIVTDNSEINELRLWLSEEVKKISSELTVHDLRMVPGTTHTNLVFDCVVPYNFKLTHSEIKKKIADTVSAKYPTYKCVIKIDSMFAPAP